ncbi:hypothetical protein LEMLEM_LOCUS21050 [Lemmus lemmus]
MVLAPASSATWSQNCVKSERQAPCPAGPPPSSSKLLRKSQLLEVHLPCCSDITSLVLELTSNLDWRPTEGFYPGIL